jgi:hypothetical protein
MNADLGADFRRRVLAAKISVEMSVHLRTPHLRGGIVAI